MKNDRAPNDLFDALFYFIVNDSFDERGELNRLREKLTKKVRPLLSRSSPFARLIKMCKNGHVPIGTLTSPYAPRVSREPSP